MVCHTDHYFSIGHTHYGSGSPCQDFALSGSNEHVSFAIVADGCSSGGHTDVGARLVALSTAQAIRECIGRAGVTGNSRDVIKTQQQAGMISLRRMAGLTQQDMLATCVFAVLSSKGGFVHLQGDGVVAFQYASGHVRMYRYDWEGNAPAYPSYAEDNYGSFITHQGGDLSAYRLTSESWDYFPETGYSQLEGQEISLGAGIGGITLPIQQQDLAEGLEFIAVFSDGVTQIDGQDWKEAVVQLLTFKGVAGEFAKRRMRRHIEDVKKTGKGPKDDIAYSVIRIEQEVQNGTL